MADTDVTQPTLNGDTDTVIDDGEEADSKVFRSPSLHPKSSQHPHRKFS